MSPKLEICVDSWAGAQAAAQNGADRIELCADLAVGGLTPTPDLMRKAATLTIPVYAMVRPRCGDFVYTAQETRQMVQDINAARDAGLAGVVFGASRDGALDIPTLRALCDAARGMGQTLHRVVDELNAPQDAVAPAIALGFERILTSGGAATAEAGASVIAQMAASAAGAVSIMPGAGVSPHNARALLAIDGVDELHGSFSVTDGGGTRQSDGATIRAMRSLLDQTT